MATSKPNGSVAVWCKPTSSASPTEFEAHFNYWRIAGDKAFRKKKGSPTTDFLEVGVLLASVSDVDQIVIYLPLKVEPPAVSDCSKYLSDPKIAQSIFNEVLSVTMPGPSGPRCVELRRDADGIFCRAHCFTPVGALIDEKELSITAHHPGTLITILPSAIQEACRLSKPDAPAYFRIRVLLEKSNPFVRVIPSDRLTQSSYDEIEYIDFRVNEARTLPISVERMMRSDRDTSPVSLRLVAFLTALPVRSQLSSSNTALHKMRLLEDDAWEGYVPGGFPEGMMVYHWKKGASLAETLGSVSATSPAVADFTAFVKLQTRRSNRLPYLALAFAIGLAGNLLAAAILCLVGPHAISRMLVPLRAGAQASAPVTATTSASNATTNGTSSATTSRPNARSALGTGSR